MRRGTLLACSLILAATPLLAQHGSAGNGYFPPGYSGDTWTGVITANNDATREVTLTYTKGDKTETFVGTLQDGMKVPLKDGTSHEVKASDFSVGLRVTVYYMEKTKKVEGQKVKVNEIFRFQVLPSSDDPKGKKSSH